MPAVSAPSPITATHLRPSSFSADTAAMPSAALIEVDECPVPKVSYSLSERFGKGARPCFCLIVVMLPARGVSALDRKGQPFDDPAARATLEEAIQGAAAGVEIARMDCHINDPEFAEAAARRLIAMMEST